MIEMIKEHVGQDEHLCAVLKDSKKVGNRIGKPLGVF